MTEHGEANGVRSTQVALLHGDLTERILAAAFEVHSELGHGLLESVYEACMAWELSARGLSVARQVALPVKYKEVELEVGFRIDLLVNDTVVIELKSIDKLTPVHESQLFTYLRLSKKRVGLLLNFNTKNLKDGIVRRVL